MTDRDPVEALRASRAALAEEQDRHQRKADEMALLVKQTDEMLARLVGASEGGAIPRDLPTIRERVIGVLRDGEVHHFNEFLKAMGYSGQPVKDTSVRGVVARMKRENEIINPDLGRYQLHGQFKRQLDADDERQARVVEKSRAQQ